MLGAHPEWQERLRRQVLGIGQEALSWESLDDLSDVDLVLQECLRLFPPVMSVPRATLHETEIEGVRIPQHTILWLQAALIHRLERYWSDPERFDPLRFSVERAEHERHPGQYFPYSNGAHICLGRRFSILQVKSTLHALLGRFRIEIPAGYDPRRQLVPFPKPVDDIPVTFTPL